jgi:Saxitoxin biosynthesis operon protein SxtJ
MLSWKTCQPDNKPRPRKAKLSAIDPRISEDNAQPGSDRNFGFVFAVVFTLIALWPLAGGHAPRWIALIVAGIFGLVAVAASSLLRPLNYIWFRFGLLLHKVVSPLLMGAVFFLCVAPMGVVMRLFGKDILSLKRGPDLTSYWIVRQPPGPEPEMMKKQF